MTRPPTPGEHLVVLLASMALTRLALLLAAPQLRRYRPPRNPQRAWGHPTADIYRDPR